jgi:hypothetical protein
MISLHQLQATSALPWRYQGFVQSWFHDSFGRQRRCLRSSVFVVLTWPDWNLGISGHGTFSHLKHFYWTSNKILKYDTQKLDPETISKDNNLLLLLLNKDLRATYVSKACISTQKPHFMYTRNECHVFGIYIYFIFFIFNGIFFRNPHFRVASENTAVDCCSLVSSSTSYEQIVQVFAILFII